MKSLYISQVIFDIMKYPCKQNGLHQPQMIKTSTAYHTKKCMDTHERVCGMAGGCEPARPMKGNKNLMMFYV